MKQRVREIVYDVVGLAGFGLALAGIHGLWGAGWTMLVAGIVLFGFYVWREATPRRRG